MTTAPAPGPAQAGPPLPPIAIAAALYMASLVLPTILAGGATYPSPYSDEATILGYFRAHPVPVLLTALLQFAASLPWAIYAATVSVRLNRLGLKAPGATIGLVGGVLASASMALSALLTCTLTRPEILDHPELIRLLHDLAFITGGPWLHRAQRPAHRRDRGARADHPPPATLARVVRPRHRRPRDGRYPHRGATGPLDPASARTVPLAGVDRARRIPASHPPSLHHTQQPNIEHPPREPPVPIAFYVVAGLAAPLLLAGATKPLRPKSAFKDNGMAWVDDFF